MPEKAPAFFKEAFARARKAGRPLVIDFWATWCAPCKRMKTITLQDPKVKKALESVELVFVDTDKYPDLAKAYSVSSIPDLFFIDRQGRIADRLRKFEEAGPFDKRLQKLLSGSPRTPQSRPHKLPQTKGSKEP